MEIKEYRPRMGFWSVAAAAFVGTLTGTLVADWLLTLIPW